MPRQRQCANVLKVSCIEEGGSLPHDKPAVESSTNPTNMTVVAEENDANPFKAPHVFQNAYSFLVYNDIPEYVADKDERY